MKFESYGLGMTETDVQMNPSEHNEFVENIETIIEQAISESKEDVKIDGGEVTIDPDFHLVELKAKEIIQLIEETFGLSIEKYIEYGTKEL